MFCSFNLSLVAQKNQNTGALSQVVVIQLELELQVSYKILSSCFQVSSLGSDFCSPGLVD